MKVGRTLWPKRYYCEVAKYIDVISTKGPAPVFAFHILEAKFPLSNEKRAPLSRKRTRLMLKMSAEIVTLSGRRKMTKSKLLIWWTFSGRRDTITSNTISISSNCKITVLRKRQIEKKWLFMAWVNTSG